MRKGLIVIAIIFSLIIVSQLIQVDFTYFDSKSAAVNSYLNSKGIASVDVEGDNYIWESNNDLSKEFLVKIFSDDAKNIYVLIIDKKDYFGIIRFKVVLAEVKPLEELKDYPYVFYNCYDEKYRPNQDYYFELMLNDKISSVIIGSEEANYVDIEDPNFSFLYIVDERVTMRLCYLQTSDPRSKVRAYPERT